MGDVTYEQILVEQRGDVTLLTLNRPERLNAWTPQMSAELARAISAANDDTAVGAIVVTGAGRGFCAGADIGGQFAAKLADRDSPPQDGPPQDGPPQDGPPQDGTGGDGAGQDGGSQDAPAGGWVRLCRGSKPLVAAINGPAIGVGLTMVLPFDQLVAAEGAKLSARFVKMGLVPELASSHFLVARCGWGAASWLALSGATITGDEAARLGLVDRAVAVEQVLDDAMALASELAANPGPQVRMIKQLLTDNASEADLDAVQRRELAALEQAYRTPEHREAVAAFLDKQKQR